MHSPSIQSDAISRGLYTVAIRMCDVLLALPERLTPSALVPNTPVAPWRSIQLSITWGLSIVAFVIEAMPTLTCETLMPHVVVSTS